VNEIKSIALHNFQSHKLSVIEPAPAGQLTVIVGPSDSGKTAIIRALRWLFYNIPQGTDFIKVGNNVAKVAIKHADGQQVTRERSRKGFNRYKINDKDRYEGFGSTVPLEVQEITGVRPVQVGDLEMCLNLAEQLDGPFLGKSVSAPAKAKILGKLAGTEEVDFAAKGVGTDIYRARQDEKRLTDEVAKLQDELKQYDYLPELAERIAQVETLLANIKEAVERKLQLEKLQQQWNENAKAQKIIDAKCTDLFWMIVQADPILSLIEQQLKKYQKLQNTSTQLKATVTELQRVDAILDITADIDEATAVFIQALNMEQQLKKLLTLRGRYSLINTNLPVQERIIAITASIPEADQVAANLVEKITKVKHLHQYSAQIQSLQKTKAKAEKDITHLADIDIADTVLSTYTKNVQQLKDLSALRLQLQDIRQRLEMNETVINQCIAEEKRCSEAYKAALLATGVCPVCGSQVSEQNLKEVV
jgi:exonuclease SbcC